MAAPNAVLDLTRGATEKRPDGVFAKSRAWVRADLNPAEWRVTVTDEVKRELAGVVSTLRRQTLPMFMLTPACFELAASDRMMQAARFMVDEGRSFAIIDRLPLDDWSEEEARSVYWLLGQLFGRPVAQTPRGGIFREVVNDKSVRGYGLGGANGSGLLTYHTDNSGNRLPPNYVSLLCLNGAQEGGVSQYCSTYTMYNAMLAHAPEYLERLFQPFYHDRLGLLQDTSEPEVLRAPALSFDGNLLTSRFSRNKIKSGYQKAGVEFDKESFAALETAVEILQQQHMAAEFLMERGHIQFINNREGLHHRTAFTDNPEKKRHLVRLWYRNEGRPLFDG
jgi:Taurine catabolism dioxygenase TauD, TfdA family